MRSATAKGQNLRSYWNVTSEILSRVWEEAEYRADIFRVKNGAHIEICEMSYSPYESLVFF